MQAHTTLEELGTSASIASSRKPVDAVRMNMARRALAELKRGDVVNLGIGIPTLVADLITAEHGIILHTENGMLGVGPAPESGGAMDYPVNAGKQPVTALPGSAYFDSATSFAMIRGGHVDAAIMGGLQVDEAANLANWAVPGEPLLGVGGAMDLATGAKRLIITMTHTHARRRAENRPGDHAAADRQACRRYRDYRSGGVQVYRWAADAGRTDAGGEFRAGARRHQRGVRDGAVVKPHPRPLSTA